MRSSDTVAVSVVVRYGRLQFWESCDNKNERYPKKLIGRAADDED